MKTRWIAAAVAALSVLSASAALAQDKRDHGKMGQDKMGMKQDKMSKGTMYCCKECKMCYSPADAKKMGMKDSMGHTLVRMTKVPAGYKMGGKKMDKRGGKM